jgi:hypothetical protein
MITHVAATLFDLQYVLRRASFETGTALAEGFAAATVLAGLPPTTALN